MRFVLYLKEEYVSSLPGNRTDYSVYKNPSSIDIGRLRKEIYQMYRDESYSVRGLIDISNKDIYLLPAQADIHTSAYNKLKKQNINLVSSSLLNFIGYIDSGKLYGENLESFTGSIIDKKIKLDWLKKYIANADTIDIDEVSAFASFK